jgi:hypothetical protein
VKINHIIILALCVTSLTGCISSGTYVDEAQVTQFKKGETTIQQVEQALGAPSNRSIMPNGDIAIGYGYMESNTRPASFIPIVGAFVGGADSRMTLASFVFNSEGVLITSTYTGSQSGSARNLSSDAPVQPIDVRARGAEQSPIGN